MEVLSIKKYNAKQTAKWKEKYDEVMEAVRRGERHITELPQLAFYLFNKSYGYVASDGKKALWAKTKREVVAWWNEEELRRKIRGG